ncbi:MAG: protein kinase [Chloroflexi bacterium]|nr:protein kinase [Chloroflexota bacterium]
MEYLTSDQVKGYTLQKPIGAGGFGEVYLATETRPNFQRDVVLKRILPKYANDPAFIQRFESEARMIARLEYPYIVPLYDYWRDPNGAYLVMRWLKGGSVKDLLERGPLDLPAAVRIMNQVCSALSLAHKNAVIHRDIKPGNILLDEEGNAYLSDFGIAKDFLKFDSNTQPEDIIGSPKYISPEQARSEAVTPRTDVYSLGVTLYEMLAGEHPFPNANMYDIIYKHLNEPLPLLASLDAAVQDDINLVIQKATAKNPQNRYDSALDFARAFHAAAQLDTTTQTDSIEQQLTIREQQVLSLIVEGKTNKEIAGELFVTAETVKWHKRNAYRKLGVSRREQAIVVARNLKLVGSDATFTQLGATSYIIDFEAENPYKGLESFTEADEANFFGRDKLVDKLITSLGQDHPHHRFLAVLGPSGSGKSSLVRAGLVPALWEGKLPEAAGWLYTNMIPRQHPVDELDIALRRVATRHAADISDLLAHNERGLVKAARLIMPDDDNQLLLIIDQFEEVFTLVESEEERVHFLNLITHAVTDSSSRVRVVITIRADYYDRPLYYPAFGDILRDRVETVLPLSAEELQQAIVEPARKIGVKFEDGLVATIISDINYQPGSLPLLQYALTEMFDQRDGRTITREVYEKIGGAAGAIASTAEQLFQEHDEEGQETIRQMFLRLVTLGEGAEDTRRRTGRDELLSIASDPDLMDEIIDTFAYARMLSLDNDPTTREPTVEVAHEAILREWERLRGWLNDSRDDIKTQRRLGQNADAWFNNNYDDSYLVTGTRLEGFERWFVVTDLSLSPVEQQFLTASITARDKQILLEQQRAEEKTRLQQRARRVLQGLVAVFVVATLISAGLALFAFDARAESDNARAEALREAEVSHSVALAASSEEALFHGDHDLAVILALEANAIDDPPPEAREALNGAVYAPGTHRVLVGHEGPVVAVDFSPDGRYAVSGGGKQWVPELAIGNRGMHYTSEDFSARLWDLATGDEIRRLEGHTDAIWDVAYSPDGKTVLTASSDTTVILWDVETGQMIHVLKGHVRDVRAVAYLPDSRSAISASTESFITWDLEAGTIAHQFYKEIVSLNPWDIDVSSDGRFALVGMRDGTGSRTERGAGVLLDLATGEWVKRFDTTGPVYAVALSPDDKTVLLGAHDQVELTFDRGTGRPIIMHIDIETGEEIARYFQTGSFVTGVDFSPDGKLAISTTLSQSLYVWDLDKRENVIRMVGHNDFLIDMALSSDGKQVLTASQDGTVRLWDLRNGLETNRIDASDVSIGNFDVSPDGRLIAASYNHRRLQLWDLRAGEFVDDLGHTNLGVGRVDFSPDGQQVAFATGDLLKVMDVASGKEIASYALPEAPGSLQYTADSRFIFVGSGQPRPGADPILTLLDVATGETLREYTGHQMSADVGDVSRDGRLVFSISSDATMRVWDINNTAEIERFESNLGNLWHVSVSPDGRYALTASEHLELIQWDLEQGEMRRLFEGHSDFAFSLDISPDGKWAVSSSANREIILWDMATGQEHLRISDNDTQINRIKFLPDGQHLVGAGDGGNIIVWQLNINPEESIAWAMQNRYIREFSCLERERYNIEARCADDGTPPPTRTPFPTPSTSIVTSATLDSIVSPSPTFDWTPIPSYTPLPSVTPIPTAPAIDQGTLESDQMVHNSIQGGFGQPYTVDAWLVEGVPGQTISIQFVHGGLKLAILDPDGSIILESIDTEIGPVVFQQEGMYRIQVTGDLRLGLYSLQMTRE